MIKFRCYLWLVFLLLPLSVAAAESVRLVVISDLNDAYGSTQYSKNVHNAISRIVQLQPDLVLIAGDLIAGQRTSELLNPIEITAMWNGFDRVIAAPLRKAGIPLLAVPGNHDASAESRFSRERKAYLAYWKKYPPELQAVAINTPLQWAWKINNLTLIGLDATRRGPLKPEAQREWLRQTLAANQKSGNEVMLVSGHLPIWAFAKNRERGILADQELEELLHNYRVDAYISGHQHAYYPTIHGGLVQISMGALGSGRRTLIGDKQKSVASFLLIDVSTDGHLKYRPLRGKNFQQVLSNNSLPKIIKTREVTLKRIDLNSPGTE